MRRQKRTTPAAVCALAFLLVFLGGCRRRPPQLVPPPEIGSVEGYASLRFSGEGGTAKSRLSFQIRLPDRGRIEVFDILGRTVLYFVMEGTEALLVVPSEAAYCVVGSDEILSRFLGFALDVGEWTALLSGVWPEVSASGENLRGWSLERDVRNRVRSGRRGGVFFEVAEFFGGSPSPRRIDFASERGVGRLTVLSLRYNSAPAEAAFLRTPPPSFEARTWEDIERLLRRED
ncbi:MAG: hypothetical protein JW747_09160 [Candidatus Aminicenantes bacterium]|nr:hypothetical protein [Candidatus Aminicenantes bacterium]